MTPLPPLAPSWSEEILDAARWTFNGELTVIKPGAPGSFNPVTDTETGGTPDATIVGWRPARAQHIRLPIENNDGNGWTSRRRFRFQCEIRPGDPAIQQGMVVRFRGGNDPTLALFAYQVVSAVNSSHAALRTIECITEGVAAG